MTYDALRDAVDGFAHRLVTLGIGPSDPVVLLLPNGYDFVVGAFSVAKIGAVMVTLNIKYKKEELKYYFSECGAKAVVTTPQSRELCEQVVGEIDLECSILTSTTGPEAPLPPREATRTEIAGEALYQYSSGSGGTPKRVVRTQANLVAEANNFVATVGIEHDDKFLTVVPLFHAHGFGNCLLAAVRAGAQMIMLETFNRTRVLDALLKDDVTVFPGVPFMFSILADSPSIGQVALPHLKLAFSAGAPLSQEGFDKFVEKFGCEIKQLYGSTEAGSITINLGSATGDQWSSSGQPMRNVEIRIVDDDGLPLGANETGEILVKSDALTAGYGGLAQVKNEEAFKDGYFWTGDLGRKDENGNLFVTARKTLFINAGGNKIDPAEVETLLQTHPKVQESVVLGVEGRYGQEIVKAVVVPFQECTAEELKDWCRGKIADFKIPRIVEFRAEIPRSPLGKTLRKYLRDEISAA